MWKIMYLSPYVVLTLGGNYILDTLIILSCLKIYRIKMDISVIFRTLTMGWILGFTSDILALMGTLILKVQVTTFVLLVTILFSGTLMFFFSRYLFLRVAISKKISFKMALIMSFFTSPWLFLIPTSTMY